VVTIASILLVEKENIIIQNKTSSSMKQTMQNTEAYHTILNRSKKLPNKFLSFAYLFIFQIYNEAGSM
jgi:hypothetical protein